MTKQIIKGSEIDRIEMFDEYNNTVIYLKNGEKIFVYNVFIDVPQGIANFSININSKKD